MGADQPVTAQLALITPEPEIWDAFVASQRYGHMLQASAWAALKATSGWHSIRLALRDATGLRAGAQVLIRRRYGLAVWYVPRGPLLSGDPGIDTQLVHLLEGIARRQRAVFLRFEPNLAEGDPIADQVHSMLLCQGLISTAPIQPRSTLRLDLAPTPEQLFAAFSKGHRADIRRAERLGVQVRVGGSADMTAFYAIMQATGQRAEFGIHQADYYANARRLFGEAARLLLAELDQQVVAAQLVFAWGQEGAYLYSGALEAGLKAGANHLLQWHALRWARERGCRSYDFWGIPDQLGQAALATDDVRRQELEQAAQSDALIGVYRFKKGFGAEHTRYLPAYDRVLIGPAYRVWRRMAG